MSDNLRSKIIRLAHQNPELRPHLFPLLKEAAGATTDLEVFEMGNQNPRVVYNKVEEAFNIAQKLEGFPGDIGVKARNARKALAILKAEVDKYL